MNDPDFPRVRIAVVQLECHPSIVVGSQDYAAEPFMPDHSDEPCISKLLRHGLDLTAVQDECRKTYAAWNEARVKSTLTWLSQLPPPIPHVIVFPEGSLPRFLLPFLKEFAHRHDSVIFAGTHAFELTRAAKADYLRLGIPEDDLKAIAHMPLSSRSVLPIISKTGVQLRPKRTLSPFENTDTCPQPTTALDVLDPITVHVRQKDLSILPYVCSEALQLHPVPGKYDIVVISSYNETSDPYQPLIRQIAANQIPVAYCNDGRYGGSSVTFPVDNRGENWWFGEPIKGCLPKGDCGPYVISAIFCLLNGSGILLLRNKR